MSTKQVIVFRKDLLKGEHAIRKGKFFTRYSASFKDGSILDNWLGGIFTKIVVSVEGEAELLAIVSELERINEEDGKCIPYALITDCGITEFGGTPTVTCLGIGPYLAEDLDKLTGNLPLL